MRQRGFTLVELVAVLVLMGVLAVVAFGRFNPADFQLREARGELLSALRHAQELSLSHTGATPFAVNLSGNGFSVVQGGAPVTDPQTAGSYTRTWGNVSLGQIGSIVFDGYGEPSLGGALGWSGNTLPIGMSSGSATATVSVERVTGYVR